MVDELSDLEQRTFRRGDCIPLKPDILWLINQGVVRTITWDEEGKFITLGYWGIGDVVGRPLSQVNPYEIECLTSVEVSIVPHYLWHQVLDTILKHVQQTQELLNIVQHEPIRLRLLHLLTWLANKFGREADQGRLIDLPLTHENLAQVSGTTRVTVTRLLKKLEQERIVIRRRHHLVFLYTRTISAAIRLFMR